MSANPPDRPALSVLESVRCLECATVYSKPSAGGTAEQNPGCPVCGYVGWISTAVPFTPGYEPRRSGVGPRPGRHVRSG